MNPSNHYPPLSRYSFTRNRTPPPSPSVLAQGDRSVCRSFFVQYKHTFSRPFRWIFLVLLNNEALYPSRPWILSVLATIATRVLLQVHVIDMKHLGLRTCLEKLSVSTSAPKPNSHSTIRVLQYYFMSEACTSTPLLIVRLLMNIELSIRCETD